MRTLSPEPWFLRDLALDVADAGIATEGIYTLPARRCLRVTGFVTSLDITDPLFLGCREPLLNL